ncbi:MAG: polymer-forming cytoskeletal protein [Henriciella sp.]|nr:polymer-forming cytoskeletal protein [Henriciella sp.]
MFTKTKGDTPPGFTPAQDAVRSASSKPASRVGASIICSDMHITGSVRSEGALQIDGKIEGDVTAGDVTVGSTGEITGEVKAETLRVKGHVNGSIRARKVELETGATVKGDIIHAALIIQPDASFEGQVKREDNPLLDTAPKAASTTGTTSTSSSTSDLSSHNMGQTGNA